MAGISRLKAETGYLCDPHTAVGLAAARKVDRDQNVPMVTLATAHPAKFPAAVEKATGALPPEPALVARQRTMAERISPLPNEYAAVSAFISQRARAAGRAT